MKRNVTDVFHTPTLCFYRVNVSKKTINRLSFLTIGIFKFHRELLRPEYGNSIQNEIYFIMLLNSPITSSTPSFSHRTLQILCHHSLLCSVLIAFSQKVYLASFLFLVTSIIFLKDVKQLLINDKLKKTAAINKLNN